MPMQHIRLHRPDHAHELHPDHEIARPWLAADRNPVHPERQTRRDFGKRLVGALAAGQAVGDNADLVPALGLSVGEIEDMTKNAADRRTHGMQNAKRLNGGRGHVRTGVRSWAQRSNGRWRRARLAWHNPRQDYKSKNLDSD